MHVDYFCRASLVCKRWHILLQDRFLVKKRLKFIEAERTAWQCDVVSFISHCAVGYVYLCTLMNSRDLISLMIFFFI